MKGFENLSCNTKKSGNGLAVSCTNLKCAECLVLFSLENQDNKQQIFNDTKSSNNVTFYHEIDQSTCAFIKLYASIIKGSQSSEKYLLTEFIGNLLKTLTLK